MVLTPDILISFELLLKKIELYCSYNSIFIVYSSCVTNDVEPILCLLFHFFTVRLCISHFFYTFMCP